MLDVRERVSDSSSLGINAPNKTKLDGEEKIKAKIEESVKMWTPTRFLESGNLEIWDPFVLLVLNQPIENRSAFFRLCERAEKIYAADGGSNRIRDLHLSEEQEETCRPQVICGDLDSIRPEVLEYYQKSGVDIVHSPDQNSTDFTKCLEHIARDEEHINVQLKAMKPPQTIVVVGGLGGRADQAFSQLHHLYLASEYGGRSHRDLYLFTPESIIFLLQKGLNKIHTPLETEVLTENVGIIPLAKPSIINTKGLEWDVMNWRTEFGTQISTSNHIKDSIVEVETTERVLFTMELLHKPDDSKKSAEHQISANSDGHLAKGDDSKDALAALTKAATAYAESLQKQQDGPGPPDRLETRISRLESTMTGLKVLMETLIATQEEGSGFLTS